MKDREYIVNSVIRAFSILEAFSLKKNEQSISELKVATGLPFSTLHRLLATMEKIGYIRQNSETGKYRLGIRNFILGNQVKLVTELRMIAAPILKSLSDKYNETVHMAVELDGQLLCIEKVEAHHRMSVTPSAGGFESLHRTSVGKCLLAFADKAYQEEILGKLELTKHTEYTITDKEVLWHQLADIRKNGYSIDNQELELGLMCFGAPIFAHSGECIAAMSLSIPIVRLGDRSDDIRNDVQKAAGQITDMLRGL